MNINYREWDSSSTVITCGGKRYLVAPYDLEGSFDQDQAAKINGTLASSWAIPTYEQMLEIAKTCKDVRNGRSYWVDSGDAAYNPMRGRITPQYEINQGLECRIRCVCDIYSAME